MFDFRIDADDKATMYRDLASALEGLVAGESDAIANMANAAALVYETLPDVNWVGFYRNIGGELVLGPFQGRPACIRMTFDEGVCGAAAKSRQVQRVEDVNAFPGHIACDSASNSEIVVPLIRDGELLGVLDIDSPKRARFTAEDEAGVVSLGEILDESGIQANIIIRQGEVVKTVRDYVAGRDEIAALVLGAAPSGHPGPLVANFAGTDAGLLPCPLMIIPGSLGDERLEQLS
jgi:GAF domain-containing protein